jgi:putative tryptophan/tyrosine transport system substrate-binding protein
MRRRDFIALTAASALACSAHAQQPARQRRIGIVLPGWDGTKINPIEAEFLDGLVRHGYVEGRNLIVDRYAAMGSMDRFPDLAAKVASNHPEVILTGAPPMTLALKAATQTIPIVTVIGDPVALGLVSSLARPGGNVTGITVDAGAELSGKRLSLLRETRPDATRLAYLSSSQALKQPQAAMVKQAAETLKLSLLHIDLGNSLNEGAYKAAYDSVAKAGAELLLVSDEPQHLPNSKVLVGIAAKAQIPAMYPFRDLVVAGGLMAYYRDLFDAFRQVADQVAQILDGGNPAEMPFRQPTFFKLSISTKAARAIGIIVPPTLLASADEVIE